MSYLHLPRLHFFGKFKTTPSTLNNSPRNFDPRIGTEDMTQLWNPTGAHWFEFKQCAIKTLLLPGRKDTTDDPLVGTAVHTTNNPHVAKIVDLDPQQQMTSEIFGMQLKIGKTDSNYVIGNFRPAGFSDLFSRVANQNPSEPCLSAYYQSVLDVVEWSKDLTSPFLRALKKTSRKRLSIKFVVDGFDPIAEDPDTFVPNANFAMGRLAGTIGPCFDGEPARFLAGRYLKPTDTPDDKTVIGKLNFTPSLLDSKRRVLIFDFGNTIPTLEPGGDMVHMGHLQLAILPKRGKPIVLAPLDCTLSNYEKAAGIQEVHLTAEQLSLARTSPIGVLDTANRKASKIRLQENTTGISINIERRIVRLNPGESIQAELCAVKFGLPAVGEKIALALNRTLLGKQGKSGEKLSGPASGVPSDVLKFPKSVITDRNGRASFKISAVKAPGNPRKYIDGQVYALAFTSKSDPQPGPHRFVSLRVFDDQVIPEKPTWWTDIVPMFTNYVRLYPFMQDRLDLGDYPTASQGIQSISWLIHKTSEDDPRYMPVTRDFSACKKKILKRWIEQGMAEGVKP